MKSIIRSKKQWVAGVPLGGLGTGSVELRGDGSLREWQIFNNWGEPLELPNAFLAVWARAEGGRGRACVLELAPRHNVPGVDRVDYRGEFPFAFLRYDIPGYPVRVSLEAFSPFIPHDPKNSAQPAFVLYFDLENRIEANCEASISVCVQNPFSKCVKAERKQQDTLILLSGEGENGNLNRYEVMAAALEPNASYCAPGHCQPERQAVEIWHSFASPRRHGKYSNTIADPRATCAPLASSTVLPPGQSKRLGFIVSWFSPDHVEIPSGRRVGHMYENWHSTARDVGHHRRQTAAASRNARRQNPLSN